MKNKQQNLTVFLFLIYLGILLWVILLKMGFSLSALHQMRRINLDPFRGMSLKEAARNSEVILNVLIFIPFGLYLRMLKVNSILTIIIGFLFSLLMETTQYILAIGYTDVTDLITNTSGTIIGVITYFFVTLPFSNKSKVNIVLSVVALLMTLAFIWICTVLIVYKL